LTGYDRTSHTIFILSKTSTQGKWVSRRRVLIKKKRSRGYLTQMDMDMYTSIILTSYRECQSLSDGTIYQCLVSWLTTNVVNQKLDTIGYVRRTRLSLSLSLSIYLSICSLLLRRYSTRRTTKKQIGTENEFLIVSSCRMTFEKINLTGSCNCPTEKINRQWRSLIVFFLFFSFLFFSFLSDCSYLWAIYWFQSSNEQLRLVRRLENDTWQKFTVVDDIKTKYRQEHTSKSKEVIFMTRNWFLLCQ
jgi:hypothetical protein